MAEHPEHEPTYHGVYLTDAGDRPVALFRDADEAQRWRRANHGDRGLVAAVDVDVPGNPDVATLLASPADAAPSPLVGAADERRKGEIRARLEAEERDKRLEEEVRREMAAEREASDEGRDRASSPAANDPLSVVSEEQRTWLRQAGFGSAEAIRRASDEDLLAVSGVGPAAVQRLREATR